jgi:WD40 repeat protein/beta-lactamase regulating signal transducer with metallopeptidase domain
MRFTALVVLSQVTTVLALTLVFSRLFARRNAALNISVNLWGLAAALACPALFAVVARTGVSWVALPSSAAPSEVATLPDPEPVATPTPSERHDPPPAPVARPALESPAPAGVVAADPKGERPAAPVPAAPTLRRRTLPDAASLLTLAWAAGTLLLTLRLLLGWRLQARLRRTLRPASLDPALLEIGKRSGLRVTPPICLSSQVRTPCSIGLFRPVLVLPESLVPILTPEALGDILIHECAHVLHRHHWVGLFQRIAAIAMWLHPLVHAVNRDLSRALEELCDNHVLASREASSYARTLLEVLEKSGAVETVAEGVGLLPPRWKLSDRIEGLLDGRRRIATKARVSAALGIGTLLAAAGAALAGIRAAVPAAPELPPVAVAAADDDPLPPGVLLRVGSAKFHHAPGIQMLAFSPDGKTLAAGGNYGVTAWDLATGTRRLQHLSCTGYVAFSPDGKRIASGGSGNSVLLWDVASGEELPRGDLTKDAQANAGIFGMRVVGFSPDGKAIYSAGQDGNVRILDAERGSDLRAAKGPASSMMMAIATVNGKLCAMLMERQGPPSLWDLESGTEVLKFAGQDKVQGGILSPDGSMVAFLCVKPDPAGKITFGADLWDLTRKKKVLRLDDTTALAFSRDGATIAGADARGSTISLKEAATGQLLRAIETGRGTVRSLAFSPDGKTLASATGQAVHLWDVATGKELPAASGHDSQVNALAISPDGKLLVTSAGANPFLGLDTRGNEDPLRVWDAATGREIRAIGGARARVDALVFSPDGKRIAAAGGTFVGLWELASAKQILSTDGQNEDFRFPHDSGPFNTIAFSPDGATLAAGARDGSLRFWKAATGEMIRTVSGEPVTSLAFSPDGKLLAVGLTDHSVRLRDASGIREIKNISIPRNNGGSSSSNGVPNASAIRVSFSPDGRVLLIEYGGGYGHRVSLWEVATAKEFLKWDQTRGVTPVMVSFSPDGTTLASTSMFGGSEVTFWDAASIRKISSFQTSTESIQRAMNRLMLWRNRPLAFTPDGKALAVASNDSTVLLWSVDPSAWPVYIRPRAEDRPLEKLWEDLASKDAGAAWRAVLEAARQGDRAVAFLKDRLHPAAVDAQAVRKMIADLDHENSETRQQASTQLKAMDSAAEPLVRDALAANPTAELKDRLRELMDAFEMPVTDLPESQRVGRAVWVLERIGTPEARALLGALSRGPAGRLSRDARSALQRLGN